MVTSSTSTGSRTALTATLLVTCVMAMGALAGSAVADRSPGATEVPDGSRTRVDPNALAAAENLGRAPAVVLLAEQADVSGSPEHLSKRERGRRAYDQLREVADRTQPHLVTWLESRGAIVQRHVIVNMLYVEADRDTLLAASARPEVSYVEFAPDFTLVDRIEMAGAQPDILSIGPPGRGGAAGSASLPAAPAVVEIGLRQIGADVVWDMGYRGESAVVAVTDTGAAFEHPALREQYRGGDEDREYSHDYNWLDPVDGEDEPLDEEGHGTHVTGIAVGGADSRQIGVAPAAEWIACRMGRTTSVTFAAVPACMDWVLAPTRRDGSGANPDLAPDIVVASWSADSPSICHSEWLRGAVANLRDAGILFVTSAGNGGPDCGTACAPGSYPEALAVANYDVQGRRIHRQSSRGPVPLGEEEIIKPDISAPGMRVNSSVPPSRYERRSGTSMAAPHVAGAAALLLSARPDLAGRPDWLTDLLMSSGSGIAPDKCGPKDADDHNNSAGRGLVHVDTAVETALAPTATPTATLTPTTTSTPIPTSTRPATVTPTPSASPTAGPDRYDVYLPWVGNLAER